MPHFLDLPDPGVAFDLFMHLGTALAVISYFRKEVGELGKALLGLVRGRRDHPALPWAKNFFFSTLASAILIVPLKGVAGEYGRSVPWIAGNLIFFGLLMYGADRWGRSGSGVDLRSKGDCRRAVLIGLFQALAIFPGVSRSGVTLTAARFAGLGRREATHYSFLLSLPIIFGGIFVEFFDLMGGEHASSDILANPLALGVGVASSFVVGTLAIHYFLVLVGKWGMGIFALYRLFLGGAIFYFYGA